MSGNIRKVWIIGSVVFASWFAVHSLRASPEAVLDDPPISVVAVTRPELVDAPLAEVIRQFATLARAPHRQTAP